MALERIGPTALLKVLPGHPVLVRAEGLQFYGRRPIPIPIPIPIILREGKGPII